MKKENGLEMADSKPEPQCSYRMRWERYITVESCGIPAKMSNAEYRCRIYRREYTAPNAFRCSYLCMMLQLSIIKHRLYARPSRYQTVSKASQERNKVGEDVTDLQT
jgi:hypothetical protein